MELTDFFGEFVLVLHVLIYAFAAGTQCANSGGIRSLAAACRSSGTAAGGHDRCPRGVSGCRTNEIPDGIQHNESTGLH